MKLSALSFVIVGVMAADPLPFPPISGPTDALASFVKDAFREVFVQDTQNLTAAISKYISPSFSITANGVFAKYDDWYKGITSQHEYISDLVMSDERVIVVPFDNKGQTGQVVHLATITGTEKGLGKFSADCMANYRVGLKADGTMVIENGDGIAAVTAV